MIKGGCKKFLIETLDKEESVAPYSAAPPVVTEGSYAPPDPDQYTIAPPGIYYSSIVLWVSKHTVRTDTSPSTNVLKLNLLEGDNFYGALSGFSFFRPASYVYTYTTLCPNLMNLSCSSNLQKLVLIDRGLRYIERYIFQLTL